MGVDRAPEQCHLFKMDLEKLKEFRKDELDFSAQKKIDTLKHPEAELEEWIARAEAETDPMNQ